MGRGKRRVGCAAASRAQGGRGRSREELGMSMGAGYRSLCATISWTCAEGVGVRHGRHKRAASERGRGGCLERKQGRTRKVKEAWGGTPLQRWGRIAEWQRQQTDNARPHAPLQLSSNRAPRIDRLAGEITGNEGCAQIRSTFKSVARARYRPPARRRGSVLYLATLDPRQIITAARCPGAASRRHHT